MSAVAGLFKARHSYDYLQIEPVVLKYLEDHHYPSLAISSMIEDYVVGQIANDWIDTNRLKHCISRALRQVGYEKRSKRGKAWEAIRGWCIRQADIRPKTLKPTWKASVQSSDADFMLIDDHPLHSRKYLSPVRPVSSGNSLLSSFAEGL